MFLKGPLITSRNHGVDVLAYSRATKTESLNKVHTAALIHLEYLLQYCHVLEAKDGYIKLFKGLLVGTGELG